MKTIIINGEIITPAESLRGRQLLIEDGRIGRLQADGPPDADARVIDASGLYVVPGFIDLHIHGADGHDAMDASPEALHAIARFIARHGVTSYLPTTFAASAESIRHAIDNVMQLQPARDGALPMGIHLEGPYVGHEYKGAQPPAHIRSADPAEYSAWLDSGIVRLITVAPEVDGVPRLIELGAGAGVQFALGHTSATYEQALDAADRGARQLTHTFNGMAPLHHRTPGVVGAALSDDRFRCQIIADGVHVHPAVVKALVRAKGITGTILVTDSMRATGLNDGDYALGEHTIHVVGGVARTDAGGLAGSTLTMDQGLRNLMDFAGLTLQEALPMATSTPAAAMGWDGRKGTISEGSDADIVLLDNQLQVQMTMIGGEVVYRSLS
jgi:N-acetylglucosamine-6-phosphate deacetylase